MRASHSILSAGLALLLAQAPLRAIAAAPRTPIQHVVVLYQENVSFDHYFASYPFAANEPGEPRFVPRPDTPGVNGISGELLHNNPNTAQPFRLPRARAATCSQDHEYTGEQLAYHGGKLDAFVPQERELGHFGLTICHPEDVMGYFDGNTVTAIWQYAQHYALGDAHFGTSFGPSTPGALNLVAGQTHPAVGQCGGEPGCRVNADALVIGGRIQIIGGTLIDDPDPAFDDCSSPGATAAMGGSNIGALLDAAGLSWGFFQGGFRPTSRVGERAVCGQSHMGSHGSELPDYVPHHQPFQYFDATANPHHLPPSSVAMIGAQGDAANHQYDLEDFWAAADAHHLPAVSYLKAPAFQNGHAGYSDPLAEQRYLVETINRLQKLPEWRAMAIVIAYDDTDGWYDHMMPPIVRGSIGEADALDAPGVCGTGRIPRQAGRCGLGPRLPLLLVSPWARENYVDHSVTEQASILRFIEDNWSLGRLGGGSADEDAGSIEGMFDFARKQPLPPLPLDPASGLPLAVKR
jgi:phospholipase C